MSMRDITVTFSSILVLAVTILLALAAIYFLWNIPLGLAVLIGSILISGAVASLAYGRRL